MMMRSTPALSVIIETGQVPQAPTSVTWTTLSASMPLNSMSPPSLWSAGRMASIASRTLGSSSSVLAVSVSVGIRNSRNQPVQPPQYRRCSLRLIHPGHVGAERAELARKVGVAAVDVVRIEHFGLPVGAESGEHERGAGADVEGAHRCTGK